MPSQPGKHAIVSLSPRNQNLQTVQQLVQYILGQAGCSTCGRVALLRADFVVDPPEQLAKEGVISYEQQGF